MPLLPGAQAAAAGVRLCHEGSHAFNLLDARGALSAVERANYILRVRAVAKACCEAYMAEVAGVNENADQEGEVA